MYSYKKQVKLSYEEAVQKAKEELKKEGFSILTEIDVKSKLKEKLDVDFDKYIILGACKPHFAYNILQAEKEIGLLLPCNVIVYEDNDKVFVSAIMLTFFMDLIKNPDLNDTTIEIEELLKKVINAC